MDLGYRYKADWMTAELNLFHNWVGDYIYQQRTGSVFNRDSETTEADCSAGAICVPVVASRQAAATFKGFEAKTVCPLIQNRYGAVDLTLFGDHTPVPLNRAATIPGCRRYATACN